MSRDEALNNLKHLLTAQITSPVVSCIRVHRTRTGTNYNRFLTVFDGHIVDITGRMALVVGLKMHPKNGGLPASQSFIPGHQVRQLGEALGLNIRLEGLG